MEHAPQGTISFLFTDIVGSSRLWEKHPRDMGAALARHDQIIRAASAAREGYVFKTVGDAFCVAFHTPLAALLTAVSVQQAFAAEDWGIIGAITVRMGLHTGAAEWRDGDYFGTTLNRAARIEAAGHGGQILLSQVMHDLLEDEGHDGIAFRSLGSHRLRNLDRPEHLYQALVEGLPSSFPPPRSLEMLPNNLPVQSTSFIGRDAELERARQLLNKTQILTLTGTGGTGKTRLALETGASLIQDYNDGVWLVELARISDPDLVPETIAGAIGVREEAEQPLLDTIIEFLRQRVALIILDNCEHLLAAASQVAGEILRHCPRVQILATSRHSLGLSGEVTMPVPPLAVFDTRLHELTGPNLVERLSQYDAVKLFIERATLVQPDFRVTNENAPALAEVCSRLDGIPLAIELAAARIRVLDIHQIAERLNDRFRLLRGGSGLPHQQTLEALIDWSHDLLTEPEKTLFRRLGAFVGGRTLEALEEVCSGDGVDEFEILDLLQQLVDKSLVTVERDDLGNPRYTMIESVWTYTRRRLEEAGEAVSVRNKHLAYYLEWAEKAGPHFEGSDQKIWLDRAQAELFNVRAAVQWAMEQGRREDAMRIICATYRFAEIRGNVGEALDVARQLVADPGDAPPGLLAHTYVAAGRLAWALDQYDEVRRCQTRALEIFESIGDEEGMGLVLMLLAFLDRGDQRLEEAERGFRRGLELGQRTGDLYVQAACESGLGSIALDHGDLTEARRLKEESLVKYEKLGDHWVAGLILWGIAKVALAQRDLDRAEAVLSQWARIALDLGNRWIVSYILECRGELSSATGDHRAALHFLGAAESLRQRHGTKFSAAETAEHEALIAHLKAQVSPDEFKRLWDQGRQTSAWDLLETDAPAE